MNLEIGHKIKLDVLVYLQKQIHWLQVMEVKLWWVNEHQVPKGYPYLSFFCAILKNEW